MRCGFLGQLTVGNKPLPPPSSSGEASDAGKEMQPPPEKKFALATAGEPAVTVISDNMYIIV
jgi:hypothetical protein